MIANVLRRGLAASAIVAASALMALGCGGSSGSGAADAAKNAKGLDFVPADALLYITLDTDLEGTGWKNVDKLVPAFAPDWEGVDQLIEEQASDEDEVDWKKDVEPWLGDDAGLAILGMKDEEPEVMAWISISDRAAFEDFAGDQDLTKGDEEGDFTIWSPEEDSDGFFAVSDDLVLVADTEDAVKDIASGDGESIKDNKDLDSVVDDVEGDAIFAMVLSGKGLKDILASDTETESLAEMKELDQFQGMSLSFSAEDEGFRVHGMVATDGMDEELLGANASTDFFTSMPGDTLFAMGGSDLGGGLEKLFETAGSADQETADSIGALEGVLGVSVADLGTAFSEEWALALNGSDEGFQSLVGSAMGAAMGGGASAIDPASLQGAALTLAFAANEDTGDALTKLFGATQLASGTPPKTGSVGDFSTATAMVEGMPITAATSDDVALVTTNESVLEDWGSGDTLGDNEAFADAWKAAGAPDSVSSIAFLDFPRIASFAQLPSGEGATAGGLVVWSETTGDDVSFDAFMHVAGA